MGEVGGAGSAAPFRVRTRDAKAGAPLESGVEGADAAEVAAFAFFVRARISATR